MVEPFLMADDAARSNTPFGPSTPRESSTATADGSTAAALATPDEAALAAGVDDPEGLGELGSPAGETSAHASPGAADGDDWWAAASDGHPDGRTEEGEDPASSDAVDYGIEESSSAGGLSDGRSPNMPATSTAPPERGPFLDGFTDAPPAVDRPAVTAGEPSSSLSSGEDRASEARALVERLPESWSLNTGDGNSWMVPETAELDRVERAAPPVPPVTTLSATLATAVAAETAAFIENETASLPGGPPDDAFLQTLGLEAAEEVAPTVTAPTPAEEPVEADEPTLERERVLAGEPTARNTERLGAIPESEAAGHIASAMPEETTKPEAAAAEPEPEPEAPASSGPDGHDDGETAAEPATVGVASATESEADEATSGASEPSTVAPERPAAPPTEGADAPSSADGLVTPSSLADAAEQAPAAPAASGDPAPSGAGANDDDATGAGADTAAATDEDAADPSSDGGGNDTTLAPGDATSADGATPGTGPPASVGADDGPQGDGTGADGIAADGTAADGTAADGTAADGTAADGTTADGTGSSEDEAAGIAGDAASGGDSVDAGSDAPPDSAATVDDGSDGPATGEAPAEDDGTAADGIGSSEDEAAGIAGDAASGGDSADGESDAPQEPAATVDDGSDGPGAGEGPAEDAGASGGEPVADPPAEAEPPAEADPPEAAAGLVTPSSPGDTAEQAPDAPPASGDPASSGAGSNDDDATGAGADTAAATDEEAADPSSGGGGNDTTVEPGDASSADGATPGTGPPASGGSQEPAAGSSAEPIGDHDASQADERPGSDDGPQGDGTAADSAGSSEDEAAGIAGDAASGGDSADAGIDAPPEPAATVDDGSDGPAASEGLAEDAAAYGGEPVAYPPAGPGPDRALGDQLLELLAPLDTVGLDELEAAFDDGSSAEALDADLLDEGPREDEQHVVEARDGWPSSRLGTDGPTRPMTIRTSRTGTPSSTRARISMAHEGDPVAGWAGSDDAPGAAGLGALLRKHWGFVAPVAAFSVGTNLIMLAAPLFSMQIYDRVLPTRSGATLLVLTGLILGLSLANALLDAVRGRLMVQLATAVASSFERRTLPLSLVPAAAGGSDPRSDVDSVRRLLAGPVMLGVFDAPWSLLFLAVIWTLHPFLGVLACCGAVVILIVSGVLGARAHRVARAARRLQRRESEQIQELRADSGAALAMGGALAIERRLLSSQADRCLQELRAGYAAVNVRSARSAAISARRCSSAHSPSRLGSPSARRFRRAPSSPSRFCSPGPCHRSSGWRAAGRSWRKAARRCGGCPVWNRARTPGPAPPCRPSAAGSRSRASPFGTRAGTVSCSRASA
ncbi:MAG: hypothetical protein GVY33_04915 [Alphaproteobacteria bacterium]|jgi:hypothetical protein|nr:hypothetical protein [Alphaproteobacteria bacterium]